MSDQKQPVNKAAKEVGRTRDKRPIVKPGIRVINGTQVIRFCVCNTQIGPAQTECNCGAEIRR